MARIPVYTNLCQPSKTVYCYVACASAETKPLGFYVQYFLDNEAAAKDFPPGAERAPFYCGVVSWELTIKLTVLENALARFLQGALCTECDPTLFGWSSVISSDRM